MFYLNKNIELTAELLQKMLNRFNISVKPLLEKNKNYYDGKHAILKKTYTDADKPCCRAVINYAKSIADAYAGYLATPGYISYSSEQDITEIMEILRYNDYNAADAALLLDALVYGVGAELMYIDAAGQTRFRNINPQQCFAVCDDSLTGDLRYFVRLCPINEWDNSDIYAVAVYSDYDIKH